MAFLYSNVESPTPPLAENAKVLSITNMVTGEFSEDADEGEVCEYAGVALCEQMSTGLNGLGGLRQCVTDSFEVEVTGSNRKLGETRTITIAQSLTVVSFDKKATEPPAITGFNLADVVEVADTAWFIAAFDKAATDDGSTATVTTVETVVSVPEESDSNGTLTTRSPSGPPSQAPSGAPSGMPSGMPSQLPTGAPSSNPTQAPSVSEMLPP
jgi:hypothetical protein